MSSASITTELSVPAALAERAAARRRLVAAAVALVCAAILGVAAWLTPSESGLGTHRQLAALPPCGWIMMADLPCPTCGMTTAFAHAADGHLLASLRAQPLGAILTLGVTMALLLSIHVVITGSRAASMVARLWGRGTACGLSTMVVAAWLYKIASYKGWL